MSVRWEPWDWGRRHQEYEEKRAKEEQATVGVGATERAVLLEVRKCAPATREHAPTTDPQRCKRKYGPAEAQRVAGEGEARSGIKQRFISSTVGSGIRGQPAATGSHCLLEGQSRFEKGDRRRMMRSHPAMQVLQLFRFSSAAQKRRRRGQSRFPLWRRLWLLSRSSPVGLTPARFVRTLRFNWPSRNPVISPLCIE